MVSEFRDDLLEAAKAYIRGEAAFQDLFVLSNALLPEFLTDRDEEASRVASDLILTAADSSRWFRATAAAIDALSVRTVVRHTAVAENETSTTAVVYAGAASL